MIYVTDKYTIATEKLEYTTKSLFKKINNFEILSNRLIIVIEDNNEIGEGNMITGSYKK